MTTRKLGLRKPKMAAALLLFASSFAPAQTRREPPAWISFFMGGGAISGSGAAVTFFGDDATFRVYRGLGVGAGEEAGWDFGSGGSFALFSGNLSYHFKRSERLGPFVTAGYSTIFRKNTREDGANFGAGMKYWFSNHLGLHAEFRNYIFTGAARDFAEFRIGFGMR